MDDGLWYVMFFYLILDLIMTFFLNNVNKILLLNLNTVIYFRQLVSSCNIYAQFTSSVLPCPKGMTEKSAL